MALETATVQQPYSPLSHRPFPVAVAWGVRPVALAVEPEAALVILGPVAEGQDEQVLHVISHKSFFRGTLR